MVELVAEARMQARIAAFDVLTPPNPSYRRLVSVIHVPILLIIADNGVVSLETAQELQNLNPRLRVERIQEAGHGLQYDQPERFEAVVRSFLFIPGYTDGSESLAFARRLGGYTLNRK